MGGGSVILGPGDIDAGNLVIGTGGGVGTLDVGAAKLTASNLVIGGVSQGTATIKENGQVQVNGAGAVTLVGQGPSTNGSLQIDSQGKLAISGPGAALRIGGDGGKGDVSAVGSGAEITVSGAIARVSVAAGGSGSSGTLNLKDGGRLTIDGTPDNSAAGVFPGLSIAADGTSNRGTVRVDGSGSRITIKGNSGFLNVAGSSGSNNGTALLEVKNGGVIAGGGGTSDFVSLNVGGGGTTTAGNGTVLIDGSGSRISLAGVFGPGSGNEGVGPVAHIGRGAGTGTMTVSNGGQFTIDVSGTTATGKPGINVGSNAATATGYLNIDGPSSKVVLSSDSQNPFVNVGRLGKGSLVITNGGVLQLNGNGAATANNFNATFMNIGGDQGVAAGGVGNAVVSGPGSRIEFNGTNTFLIVGRGSGANSSLTINNGGAITSPVATLIGTDGGTGFVVMNNGTMNMSGTERFGNNPNTGPALVIGRAGGAGTLEMTNGSSVTLSAPSTPDAFTAVSLGGSAGAEIVGPGSGTLLMSGGSKLIINGGSSNSGVFIGRTGGTGNMTVTGAGTAVAVGRVLVGVEPFGPNAGTGTLKVADNGYVNAGGLLGVAHDGVASSTGTGKLIIESGGRVLVSNLYLGANGSLELKDSASQINLGGDRPGGLAINVFQGQFKAETGSVTSIAVTQPIAVSANLAVGILREFPNQSVAKLAAGSELRVSTPGWQPTKPGENVALMRAEQINNQGAFVQTPSLNNGLIATAEVLRAGCNGGPSFPQPSCGVDVMGLRTVAQAQGQVTGSGQIPVMSGLVSALNFATGDRAVKGALLSQQVYSATPAGGLREISHIELDGLRAYALETRYSNGGVTAGGDITIVIRGTENDIAPFANNPNWATDFGFAGVNDPMREYVQNLSAFTASVLEANPGAKVRFVGHSLGGGLAMILGAASGYEAFAFNAPPVGNVVNSMSIGALIKELAPIAGRVDRGGEFNNLFQVNSLNDVLHAVPLTGNPLGQWLTIGPSAFEYYMNKTKLDGTWCSSDATACTALNSLASQFGGGFVYDHSMMALLPKLLDPLAQKTQALQLAYNGQVIASAAFVPPELADALSVILLPQGRDSVKRIVSVVSAYTDYFIDPDPSQGFLFTSLAGSPLFQSVLAPDLGIDGLHYSLQLFDGTNWITADTLDPLERFYFADGGVDRFRMLADLTSLGDLTNFPIFFGVTFASAGDFRGELALLQNVNGTAPEPSTLWLLALALLVLTGMNRVPLTYRRRS